MLAAALLLAGACKKAHEVQFAVLPLNTNSSIYDIHFFTDSIGMAVGGDYWTKATVFTTTDAGATWQDKSPALSYNQALRKIIVQKDGTVMLGGNGGIMLQTDSAFTNYNVLQHPSWHPIVDVIALGTTQFIVTSSPAELVVSASKYGNYLSSKYTEAAFGAIKSSNNKLTLACNSALMFASATDTGVNLALAGPQGDVFTSISQIDNKAIACGYGGKIYLSSDSGTTWQLQPQQVGIGSAQRVMCSACSGNTAFVAGRSGLLASVELSSGAVTNFELSKQYDVCGMHVYKNESLYLTTLQGNVIKLRLPL
ncbi:MAG: Photosynthesis system assembly factor [Bacteroidota bacterium]|jgi:hypothetical protein